MSTPIAGWLINVMENPMKMDDSEVVGESNYRYKCI